MSDDFRRAIRQTIRTTCHPFRTPAVDRFAAHFQERFPLELKAVIAYGSRLSQVTSTSTSIFDFFLVCGDYDRFYGRKLLAILNRFLPPNIMGAKLEAGAEHPPLSCKFNVVGLERLAQEPRLRPRELYLLGRFSKRMGIAWVDGPETLERLVDIYYAIAWRMGVLVLPTLPRCFDEAGFARGVLGLSYLADERVEAADKVERLFRAEESYYHAVYGGILQLLVQEGLVLRTGQGFQMAATPSQRARQLGRLHRLIRASRWRGRLRWAKYVFTFDDWVDYVIDKVERSTGRSLNISEAERQRPLRTAARYYLRFRKEGQLT